MRSALVGMFGLTLTGSSLLVAPPAAAQDTLVVRADGPHTWGERLQLVEEVRIGVVDGDERYVFGRVAGVVPAAEGSVWVADGQAQIVRRYDESGAHLEDIGGPGDGPGEFKSIMDLAPYRGDSVAVWDAHAWRVSLFDRDGVLGRTVSAGFPGSILGGGEQFVTDTEGAFWVKGVDLDKRSDVRNAETPWIWGRTPAEGGALDTLPQAQYRIDGPYMGGQRYGLGLLRPFGVWTQTLPSPAGYLVVARNDRYAITRPLRDGRVVRIERSWSPILVERDERSQFESSAEHVTELWAGRYDFSTNIPDTKPPFWTFWIDDDARIWVARHVEAHHRPETEAERAERERLGELRGTVPPKMEWWEPVTLDLFEPNGRFLGTVVLPSSQSRPVAAHGRQLWTVEKGEYDESYVVRYRIGGGS